MTKKDATQPMDDLMQMAREAGFVEYELEDYTASGYDVRYERFAQLVAKKAVEADVLEIAEALRKVGLTLVKTGYGYRVMDLGQITAGPAR